MCSLNLIASEIELVYVSLCLASLRIKWPNQATRTFCTIAIDASFHAVFKKLTPITGRCINNTTKAKTKNHSTNTDTPFSIHCVIYLHIRYVSNNTKQTKTEIIKIWFETK